MKRNPTTKFSIKIPPEAWRRMSPESRSKFAEGVGMCLAAATEGMLPAEADYFLKQLDKEMALLKSKPKDTSHKFRISVDVDD